MPRCTNSEKGPRIWTTHTLSDYIEFAERYFGFQQPGSVYSFAYAGDGCKRLSWTFEKEGTKLDWRWKKCQPSADSKKTTVEIFDFLMDVNIKLSFVQVLNSKKAKLKELRDRLPKKEATLQSSADKTKSLDQESDEGEQISGSGSSSKIVPASGRKRK